MIFQVNENQVIQACQIIGTDRIYFTLWERISGIGTDEASTITTFTEFGVEGWFGQVGTDPRKSGIKFDHLEAGSDERIEVVQSAYDARYKHARKVIFENVPCLREVHDELWNAEVGMSVNNLPVGWNSNFKTRR